MQRKSKFKPHKLLAGPAPDTANTANTADLIAQLQRSTDRLNRQFRPGTPQRPAWQWAAIDSLLFVGRVFKHQTIIMLGYLAGFFIGWRRWRSARTA